MGPPSYIGCKGNGVTQETAHETAVFLQNKKQIFFCPIGHFKALWVVGIMISTVGPAYACPKAPTALYF